MGDNLFSMIFFHTFDKGIEVEQWDASFRIYSPYFFYFSIHRWDLSGRNFTRIFFYRRSNIMIEVIYDNFLFK